MPPALLPQWQELELSFTALSPAANPYVDTLAWVDFTHEDGTLIRRPMFWDGGASFKVRFASTKPDGLWFWRSFAEGNASGLCGHTGQIHAAPPPLDAHSFYAHGFWSIPHGKRNLYYANGSPVLLCGDTAWALPWRATEEQALTYAKDRQSKGFNAALLMTVQPDMECVGPRSRTEDLGFDVGFEDLPQGTLKQLVPDYFRRFDKLVDILVRHGIAPVYQPIFHGYGWKGRKVAGNVVSPEDYARYCRYLVARYGARPAIWLIGGDGPAEDPFVLKQLDAAGQMVEMWDAYSQPTGIHYSPHAQNRSHQEKRWLDFQWCQTGHNGEHIPERVADMWRNLPIKAVANGEPTYEEIGAPGRGAGWWQGHEAWCNLTAGGTMGIVYGAGSLWQWRLHPAEPDHQDWCMASQAGWREALDFPGSRYPGVLKRLLDGLPFSEMQPNWDYTYGRRGLAVPGKLFVLYLPDGGGNGITSPLVPRPYRIFDARTGALLDQARLPDQNPAPFGTGPDTTPKILIFWDGWEQQVKDIRASFAKYSQPLGGRDWKRDDLYE